MTAVDQAVKDGRDRREALVGGAIILALAVFLRAYNFGVHDLWNDEYGTWWAIAGDGLADVFDRAVAVQGQSPLYYVLVRLIVEVLGVSPFTLRLLSLVAGIAIVWCGMSLARALFLDVRVGLAVGAVLAIDETLINYSHDARPYALALLCAVLSTRFYVALLRGPSRGAGIGWVVATALTWYAHYVFGVVVAIQLTHLLTTRPWQQNATSRWLRLGGATALLMAPGLWQFLGLFGRRQSLDWFDTPETGLTWYLLDDILHLDAALLAAVITALCWALLRGPWNRKPWRGLGLVGLWLCLPVLIVGLVPELLGVSLLNPRYAVVVLPATALLVGRVLTLSRPGGILGHLPTLLFVAFGIVWTLLPLLAQNRVFCARVEHPWHALVPTITAEHRDGDAILYATGFIELDSVARGKGSAMTVSFVEFPITVHLGAANRLPRHALPYGRFAAALQELHKVLGKVSSAQRVWVIGLGTAVDYLAQQVANVPSLRVVTEAREGDIRLLLLTRE